MLATDNDRHRHRLKPPYTVLKNAFNYHRCVEIVFFQWHTKLLINDGK